MKLRSGLLGFVAALLCTGMANAGTLRVVAVQTSEVAAYTKAVLTDGQALLKRKGSPAQFRVWQATFAGEDAGTVVVSVEYPNMEALAKDMAMLRSDPELLAWLAGLGKMRKVLSDSIYEELKP
jgi:hypothetical protein